VGSLKERQALLGDPGIRDEDQIRHLQSNLQSSLAAVEIDEIVLGGLLFDFRGILGAWPNWLIPPVLSPKLRSALVISLYRVTMAIARVLMPTLALPKLKGAAVMRRPMDGKVAMITGAGRGIGRTIALELASRGATLVLTDRNAGALSETASLIFANLTGAPENKVNEPHVCREADVTDLDQIVSLCQGALAHLKN
jgi:hypothetical protein